MSDNEMYALGAAASQMAAYEVLNALIATLKESGALDTEAFKENLAKLQQMGASVPPLNKHVYEATIALSTSCAEGKL